MTGMPSLAAPALKREHRNGARGSRVVEEIVRETGAPRLGRGRVPSGVRARSHRQTAPLLAGAAVVGATRHRFAGLLKRLIRAAVTGGTPKMSDAGGSSRSRTWMCLTLFTASVCQDSDASQEIAGGYGADAEALQAVCALVAVPFLQACNRHWASSASRQLGGRILSGLRVLAGICRSARHRAQPLLPVRPVWRRSGTPARCVAPTAPRRITTSSSRSCRRRRRPCRDRRVQALPRLRQDIHEASGLPARTP